MGEPLGPVLALCDAAIRRTEPVLVDAAVGIRDRAGEPLRVGVVGRVNAGKSTLVNALIGQRAAATGPTERTRLTTWFRSGPYDRVEAVGRDGERTPSRLVNGAVPDELGRPTSELDHVEVQLSTRRLADMVLVDTPGIGSMSRALSVRGAAVLDGDPADRVDAVIFAFDSDTVVGVDQQEILAEFGRHARGGTASNAIAVLSKADVAGDGSDPWPAAERLCADIGEGLPGTFGAVLPVVGLIAETVEAGQFTEADAEALRLLAEADPTRRRLMLTSAERFLRAETAVPVDRRRRLLDRLGLHGIGSCLESVDAGTRGAAALAGALRSRSRFTAVQEAVRGTLLRHACAIKASAALERLEELAWDRRLSDATRLWLADEVERVRLHEDLHVVNELRAVAAVDGGEAELPADLAVALRRFPAGDDDRARLGLPPDADACDAARVARALGLTFRALALHCSPSTARVVATAERSCLLIAERFDRGDEG